MKIFGHFTGGELGKQPAPLHLVGNGVGPSTRLMGARVATNNFLFYLLKYGGFDEYHLYFPQASLVAFPSMRAEVLGSFQDDGRIQLHGIEEFAERAARAPYHVLHRPGGPFGNDWLYMRNRFAGPNTPFTSVTHTISYQSMLTDIALLLLAGPRPWDSIICTARSARQVLANLISLVETGLQAQLKTPLRYEGRIDTIPLGVDTDLYRPREKGAVREQLGLPRDAVVLLYFGRLSPYDKADLGPLLVALKEALTDLPADVQRKTVLLIAGDDSHHSYSETLRSYRETLGIADKVIFRPSPAFVLGPLYYSAADVFVCPSDNLQETFGQAVIEALASGLPIVCSDWDGFRDLVVHGESGFRISTYWADCDARLCDYAPISPWVFDHLHLSQGTCVDVAEMAQAIRGLILSVDLRREMGSRARNDAVARFDWKTVIVRYQELWNELHELARSTKHSPRAPAASWLRPAYCRCFQSYPTRSLGGNTHVRATVTAPALISGVESLPQYKELSHSYKPHLAREILEQATLGASLQELEVALSSKGLSDPESIRWHVLRLLKYHYLTIVGDHENEELASAFTMKPSRST